jgi:hypothetical protein
MTRSTIQVQTAMNPKTPHTTNSERPTQSMMKVKMNIDRKKESTDADQF